jgi:Putative polyhydroxyalkanoic acid system protein (PHA_gran_rgn)
VNVSGEHFAIDCKLGILYGAFKNKIEEEVARQLDTALAKETAKVAKA